MYLIYMSSDEATQHNGENKMKNTTEFLIDYDLEDGFAFLWNDELDKNVFQVCLVQRKDGKGYRKAIRESDCGWNEGICGGLNFASSTGETIKIVKAFFFTEARKAGIKII